MTAQRRITDLVHGKAFTALEAQIGTAQWVYVCVH